MVAICQNIFKNSDPSGRNIYFYVFQILCEVNSPWIWVRENSIYKTLIINQNWKFPKFIFIERHIPMEKKWDVFYVYLMLLDKLSEIEIIWNYIP